MQGGQKEINHENVKDCDWVRGRFVCDVWRDRWGDHCYFVV